MPKYWALTSDFHGKNKKRKNFVSSHPVHGVALRQECIKNSRCLCVIISSPATYPKPQKAPQLTFLPCYSHAPPPITVHVPPSTAMSAHPQVPKLCFWPGLEPLRAPERDLELHSDCMAQTENSSCKRWYFGLVILKIHCR